MHAAGGPLCGLTLAVKDLFHMTGLPTTAGNPTWAETHGIPQQTASVVTRLLENGACYVGKTITDELAYSLNGQNIHYGMPENPVTPDRLPGGSSSGSAVAVAQGIADIGLGTDTGGSIRVPASYLGLFGLRPTHGIIPTDNMVALAPSFDTVGVMTKNLETLSTVMDCLLPSSFVEQNVSLAVVDDLLPLAVHREYIQQSLAHIQRAWPQRPPKRISLQLKNWPLAETFRVLQGAEIWQQHGDWLMKYKPRIADDIQLRLNDCATLTKREVASARAQRDRFNLWFAEKISHSVFVIPTTPGISPLISTSGSELTDYRKRLLSLTAIAGLSGCPQLHLPLYEHENAPCGLSLIGPRGSDKQLLKIAKDLTGIILHEEQ
ncbi:amidase [Aestuariibacter sp. A3R04]|uniref:amidase n=1 Tax=Aestuariibacter sp. A3R04 TaxID=2841571 RepID=UPI001C08D264